MTYEEFEWHILRMAYEDDVDRVRPSMLAYTLGIPIDVANAYLEQAVHSSVLELDVADDGGFEYYVPGIDRTRPAPKPVWREHEEDHHHEPDDGLDGSVAAAPKKTSPPKRNRPTGLPPNLVSAISRRQEAENEALNALVPYDDSEFLPMRVETNDEAFCDASRTMFMRQIRVYGAHSKQGIAEQVQRLFQSLGYRLVEQQDQRLRFHRGSVMFLLALVPLFVLVIPLIVYLFMYAMGRSTIQQEPVELDVQFRRTNGPDPYWEIDLTYVALHGVVLGAADQQQLNREIDTLKEELQWALSGP
ncbi:MAG: hypothetical protein R3E66_20875 [bacterium]